MFWKRIVAVKKADAKICWKPFKNLYSFLDHAIALLSLQNLSSSYGEW